MAIESISRAGAAAYQASSAASQARHVEQVQPVEAVEAQPAVQAQTVQQTGRNSSQSSGDGRNREQNIEKDNERVRKAVADLNKKMDNTSCQFGVHEGTGRVTIKIIDKETKDVIKEFPAEETLDMIEKVWELAGIMVDEKR